MRTLTDHVANPANEALTITILDEPGQGGACHDYGISAVSSRLPTYVTEGLIDSAGVAHFEICRVRFQNGPIKEFGVNGLTQEALLAIVIDRLRSFQEGPFRCRENAVALTHCEDALMWLQKRTRERMARGVEGTNRL